MRVLLLTLLLLVNSAHAVQQALPLDLEEAMVKMHHLQLGDPCRNCPIYSRPTTEQELLKACINIVCPDKNLPVFAEEDAKAWQDFNHRTLYPAMSKAAERASSARARLLDGLKEWLKSNPQLANGDTIVLNLMRYMSILREVQLKTGLPKGNIDMSEVRASNSDFTKNEEQDLQDFYDYFVQQRLPLETTDWEQLNTKYGEQGAKDKVRALISATENVAKNASEQPGLEIIAKDPSFSSEFTFLERTRLRLDTGRIGAGDLHELVMKYYIYKLFLETARDKKLAEILSRKKFVAADYLKDPEVKGLLSKPAGFDPLRNVYGGGGLCETYSKQLFFATPTDEQVQQLEKQIPTMVDNFLKSLELRLSKHSMGVIRQAAKGWKIVPPKSREKQIEAFKKNIETRTKEAQKPRADSIEKSNLGRAMFLMYLKNWRTSKWPADSLCEGLFVNPVNDSAKDGRANLSAVTARFPDHKAAVYHELAHLLREVLQKPGMSKETLAWLNKTDECLKDIHHETTAGKKDQYLEEDWSDLLAFSQETKQGTYACLDLRVLVHQGKDPALAYSYVNKDSNDLHSSPFFRVLHSHLIQKKSIPAACSGYARMQGASVKLRNCLGGVKLSLSSLH